MYGYDTYDRPLTTTYPDGDVVQVVGYDSRGMATGLTSKLGANAITLVDNVQYDAAGRLVQLRYLYGGGVYVNHYYRPWTGSNGNSNGRYWGMNVGTTAGGYDLATTWYGYDTFGNVVGHAISERGSTIDNVTFAYDDQQRVTSAYGQTFKWRPSGNFEEFDGVDYSYSLLHPHAVASLNGLDRYDYDLNGNMVVRWRADKPLQTLKWNADYRLGQVSHPGFTESYLYDENGVRIRKTSNGVSRAVIEVRKNAT